MPAVKSSRWTLIAGLGVVLASCTTTGDGPSSGGDATTTRPSAGADTTAGEQPATTEPLPGDSPVRVYTTAGGASGNRVVAGAADLSSTPLEVQLDATPAWVVAAPLPDRIVWVVADVDGGLTAYSEQAGAIEPFSVGDVALPAGSPPTVVVSGSALSILQPTRAAELAGPILVDVVPITVTNDGFVDIGGTRLPDVAPLPDGRIVVSSAGTPALLAAPTDRLRHAVLGDQIEAGSVVLLDPETASVRETIDAPDGTVFEAISPLWGDIDGDGADELLVTASDGAVGARLVVYRADGSELARSPAIGRGNRWLNQLAVARVGPNGEIEVIEVRTPHIGGIVRWYRLEGDALVLQAEAGRYSTHRIGSRNLDQGIAIDADGDGRLDVVVPTQDQTALEALTRRDDTAEITVTQPLGAQLATNLTGATRPDGTASMGLGTSDARLIIWP